MEEYQSNALIIAMPLGLFIQHIYYQVRITFGKKHTILFSRWFFFSITFFCIICGILKVFPLYICVELFASTLGCLVVCKFIHKYETELPIKNFESDELIMIIVQIIIGIIACFVPVMKWYRQYVSNKWDNNIIILSIILFEIYGLSLIFFNRLVFCNIYERIGKK